MKKWRCPFCGGTDFKWLHKKKSRRRTKICEDCFEKIRPWAIDDEKDYYIEASK